MPHTKERRGHLHGGESLHLDSAVPGSRVEKGAVRGESKGTNGIRSVLHPGTFFAVTPGLDIATEGPVVQILTQARKGGHVEGGWCGGAALSTPKALAMVSSIRDYVTFLKVNSRENSEQLLNNEKKHKTLSSITRTALTPSSIMFVCLLLGIAGYIFWARRKSKYGHNQSMLATESSELQDVLPFLLTRFSYKDLLEATKGFGELLGVGPWGLVYAGVRPDGRKVAVKVLQNSVQDTGQSKQFLAEIAAIGHHNRVHVGFCWEFSRRLLVCVLYAWQQRRFDVRSLHSEFASYISTLPTSYRPRSECSRSIAP